jgi:rhomboid protease GluP
MGSYPPPSPSHGMVHDDDLAQPEVLPQSAGTMEAQPVRRSRSRWLAAPATYLLVGINCAVFLWMVSRGVSPMSPTVDQLMHFGADNAGNVLVAGQWWRIVTAMFVHVGFLHLATNMWCLVESGAAGGAAAWFSGRVSRSTYSPARRATCFRQGFIGNGLGQVPQPGTFSGRRGRLRSGVSASPER